MATNIYFTMSDEVIRVNINGKDILFRNETRMGEWRKLEDMPFTKERIFIKFPDLKDNPEWKKIAVQRLKEHIANMKSENEIADYIVVELKQTGAIPKYKQRNGFRVEVLK